MTTCFASDIKRGVRKPRRMCHHSRSFYQPAARPCTRSMLTCPFASLKIISLSFQRLRASIPTRAALGILGAAVAVGVALWSFVALPYGLLLTLIAAWFTLPGILFGYFVYDAQPGRGLAAIFVGPVWGYGASSVVLLAMWTAGGRGPVL